MHPSIQMYFDCISDLKGLFFSSTYFSFPFHSFPFAFFPKTTGWIWDLIYSTLIKKRFLGSRTFTIFNFPQPEEGCVPESL